MFEDVSRRHISHEIRDEFEKIEDVLADFKKRNAKYKKSASATANKTAVAEVNGWIAQMQSSQLKKEDTDAIFFHMYLK